MDSIRTQPLRSLLGSWKLRPSSGRRTALCSEMKIGTMSGRARTPFHLVNVAPAHHLPLSTSPSTMPSSHRLPQQTSYSACFNVVNELELPYLAGLRRFRDVSSTAIARASVVGPWATFAHALRFVALPTIGTR